VADETRWVDRRVETMTFVDDTTAMRETSVHFTGPNFVPTDFERDGVALTVVPVAMLRKAVLRNFSVRDSDGNALPMLTREKNAEIAAQLLYEQAREVLTSTQDPDLCWEVKWTLAELAGLTKREPREVDKNGEFIRVSDDVRDRQAKALVDDPTMFAQMLKFNNSFLMLVPYDVRPGETHLIKFGYETDFASDFRDGDDEGESSGHVVNPFLRALRRFPEFFGLLDFRTGYPTPGVFDARSYHIEVVAPDELIISEAVLMRSSKVRKSTECPDPSASAAAIPTAVIIDEPIARDWTADRAHLYTDGEQPESALSAWIEVNFCLRLALVLPVFLLSLVTTLLLVGGLIAHYRYGLSRSGDTAAALIVALPTFFAPAVAPGGHRLVLRMFKGMRALVFSTALLSFAAAVSLAIHLSTHARVVTWWGLFGASAVISLIAVLALIHSWWKSSSLHTVGMWMRGLLYVAAPSFAALFGVVRHYGWDGIGAGLTGILFGVAACLAALGGWGGILRIRRKRRLHPERV
jgi:hypothetical protein